MTAPTVTPSQSAARRAGTGLRAAGIGYDRAGAGEPLVLVHGLGGSRRIWEPVLPFLTERRDVITVDLPGFGASPALPTGVTPTNGALADRLVAFFDALGLDRPHVAGTSLGGHVCLELGVRRAVRSVTVTSPTGFWTKSEMKYTRRLVSFLRASAVLNLPVIPLLARSAAGRRVLVGSTFHRPGNLTPAAAVDTVRTLVRSPGLQAVADAANRERLGGAPASTAEAASVLDPAYASALAAIPVTIAWAEHDKFLKIRQADRARAALPAAQHVVLRGCGHLATWDDPEAVAELFAPTRTGPS